MDVVTWLGIAFCLSQSALFSGLNLAVFGVSRLRLETEASTGNPDAVRLLAFREDSHFLLTTILWGNVGINVLLTLLSNSVMAGVSAFLFSTIIITFFGEIFPQAYLVRHARVAARLTPLLRFYQFVLFPVAKPSAKVLDWWLGSEGVEYFRERDLKALLHKHADDHGADEVSRLEGIGAANFLALDDVLLSEEGERVDEKSIISLPFSGEHPVFPPFGRVPEDALLRRIQASGKKWVVLTDLEGEPRMLLDADGFLRGALFDEPSFNALACCHRPILSKDPRDHLGALLGRFHVVPESAGDDVVDDDVILLWSDERRVLTGADILGRLLRGIAHVGPLPGEGGEPGRIESQAMPSPE